MLHLYTYQYWSPEYRQHVTLDCPAETRLAAYESARRFLVPRRRQLRRTTDGAWTLRLPRHPWELKRCPSETA